MKRSNVWRIVISAMLFLAVIILKGFIPFPFNLIAFLCVYALIGWDILFKAFKNIVRLNVLDENFLMAVATVGAFIIGEYAEGVAVMLFYQVGEAFQGYATERSRKSVQELMDMCPENATVIRNEKCETVYPEEVEIGEILMVKPGEKIAIDGIVESGSASLDLSALTGESVPVAVKTGDNVLSGSINLNGVITVKTQKNFCDSTVSKILELVQNASTKKSKVENFISRFARVYTPLVCGLALVIAVLGSLITKDVPHWTFTALSFLVISCPCALVISVPMGFFGGIGSCSKRGVLVKGGNYLEQLASADLFLFDKTGTLTKGEFSVTYVEGVDKDRLLQFASNCEQYSNHPVARAIVNHTAPSEGDFEVFEIAGKGIIATKNNLKIICGNTALMAENAVDLAKDLHTGVNVHVAVNGEYLGCITVCDSLKESSKTAISSLIKSGARCKIISGDREENVKAIANECGVNEYIGGLLPHEKVEIVDSEMKRDKKVNPLCFVGDGINDAPAIMRADVGISMGALGSDSAIEASDIVIMNDDLNCIYTAKKIAKKTMRIVKQNVIFSLAVKFAVLALCVIGIPYPMWFAVFADVGVAFLAILNSMRCL